MKYIRTDNGVYGYKEDFGDMLVKTHLPIYCAGGLILKSGIIKQADTIEELCDEFIFFDDKNYPFYKSHATFTQWEFGTAMFIKTVRGAIFTDKGLIYVAKMNSKGELELL